MSTSEPRPLPSRALPPISLQNGDGSEVPVTRTPRKKSRPSGTDGPSSGRARRSANVTRSPDSQKNHNASENDLKPPPVGPSVADEAQASESGGPSTTRRRRKKRRGRPPTQNQQASGELTNGNPIASLLNDEDVVNVEKIDDAVVMTNLPGVAGAGSGGSALADKVYVQTTNGFAARNQDWVNVRHKADDSEARLPYGVENVKPFHIAEQNERIFMFVTLVLHGALAGLAIWQVVISYSLFYPGEQNFLTQYQSLAMPTQTVYYIILVLCTVSAMDRYDFAHKDKHIFQSLAKFDLAAVSMLVYYIGLLFSIGMTGLDAWIGSGVGLPVITTTTTTSPPSSSLAPLSPELTGSNLDPSTTINAWLILNVFRAVFACLGWLIIAFDPLRNDMTWED